MNAAQFSRSLGWFSISLGLAELISPRRLAHAIGVSENHDRLIRALGAREIASGLGLLAQPKPTYFAWSRVAGDIMDLSLLGAACSRVRSQPLSVSRSNDDDRRRLTIAMAVVGAVAAVDFLTSVRLTKKPKTDPKWRYQPPGGRGGLRRPLEVIARIIFRSISSRGRGVVLVLRKWGQRPKRMAFIHRPQKEPRRYPKLANHADRRSRSSKRSMPSLRPGRLSPRVRV